MRFLQSKTFQLKEFIGDDQVPPYAILSHTWGDEEVVYQDLHNNSFEQKLGFKKIKYCCDQAAKDGFDWVWIDTCCIDKSSSAELSETINSMFRWYQNSEICYVYLADVPREVDLHYRPSPFSKSRWFTRGWTLQELIAPSTVQFYTQCWSYLGCKDQLCDLLSEITGIEVEILEGSDLELISAAKKMSWAAYRETTRSEDIAYWLLGIFNINMPMIYGEGRKAFFRLQEEIIKSTSDHSIFAWGMATDVGTMDQFYSNSLYQWRQQSQIEQRSDQSTQNADSKPPILYRGLLADSPAEFAKSGNIIHLTTWPGYDLAPITVTSGCVRIELPLVAVSGHHFFDLETRPYTVAEITLRNKWVVFVVLGCRTEDNYDHLLALPVKAWDTLYFGRIGAPVFVPLARPSIHSSHEIRRSAETIRVKPEKVIPVKQHKAFVIQSLPGNKFGYKIVRVHCTPAGSYHPRTQTVKVGESTNGPQAALVFCAGESKPKFVVVLGRQQQPDELGSFKPWVQPFVLRTEDADVDPGTISEVDSLTEDQVMRSLQGEEAFEGSTCSDDTCLYVSSDDSFFRVDTKVWRTEWIANGNQFSDLVRITLH